MNSIPKDIKRQSVARVLAVKLDEFLYDYDHYGYMDALEDVVINSTTLASARAGSIEKLESQLLNNATSGIMETLAEIADEASEEYAEASAALSDEISKTFPDPSELETNEEWAVFLSERLGLSRRETDDIAHDLNNLRADEWVDEIENAGEYTVQVFKDFFCFDKERDLEKD